MKIQSNSVVEINKALKILGHRITSAKEILFQDSNPTGAVIGCYVLAINSLTGEISYKDDAGEWQLIPGSGGTQTLQQTLTQGNTGDLPILLTDDAAKVVVSDTAGDNITTLDPDQLVIQNSTGFGAYLRATNPTSNIIAEFQDASGTIAYLSDIAGGSTPMTINTKVADYTLQLIDGDNNSLVEMNMGVANNITLDNSIAFPIGTSIMVSSKGAGQTTVVAAGGAVIHTPNAVSTVLTHQDSMGVLIKRDATNWYFSGDIGPSAGGAQGLQDVIDQDNALTGDRTIDLATNILTFGDGSVIMESNELATDVLQIQVNPLSTSMFSITDRTNPLSHFLEVTKDGGTMYKDWLISNGGRLTISTSDTSYPDLIVLNNSGGGIDYALSVDDTNGMKIRNKTANVNLLSFNASNYGNFINRLGINQASPTAYLDITGVIGQTQTTTDGIALTNNTAAANGAQQWSPALRFKAQAWTGASTTKEFRIYQHTAQGGENYLAVESRSGGAGAWTTSHYFFDEGSAQFQGHVGIATGIGFNNDYGAAGYYLTSAGSYASPCTWTAPPIIPTNALPELIVDLAVDVSGGNYNATTEGIYRILVGDNINAFVLPDAQTMTGKTIKIILTFGEPTTKVLDAGLWAVYAKDGSTPANGVSAGSNTFTSDGLNWYEF